MTTSAIEMAGLTLPPDIELVTQTTNATVRPAPNAPAILGVTEFGSSLTPKPLIIKVSNMVPKNSASRA